MSEELFGKDPFDWRPDPPGPVPPDPLGNEFRSALALRLMQEWGVGPTWGPLPYGITTDQARNLALWAAATARLLAGELEQLHGMTAVAKDGAAPVLPADPLDDARKDKERIEQLEAALTATRQALSEYGQHKADCNSRLCRHEMCKLGLTEVWVRHERGGEYYDHDFEPRECSCGLAEALNGGRR